MQTRSKKKTIIIVVILLAILLPVGLLLMILHGHKGNRSNPNPGGYVQKIYVLDAKGKWVLDVTDEYYVNEDGKLVTYKRERNKIGSSQIVDQREYDEHGRLISQTETERIFGVVQSMLKTTYTYQDDSDLVTEILVEDSEDNSDYHALIQYDDQGRQIVRDEDYSNRGTPPVHIEYEYNDQGVLIGEVHYSSSGTVYMRRYDKASNTIDLGQGVVFTLDEKGRIKTENRVAFRVEYKYSDEENDFSCEELMYNQKEELINRKVYDGSGRLILTGQYEDGEEVSRIVVRYDAEDPTFPGGPVQIEWEYTADENGELIPVRETRKGAFKQNLDAEIQRGGQTQNDVYYEATYQNGTWVTEIECTFYPDGTVKTFLDKDTYTEYDERGGWAYRITTTPTYTTEQKAEYEYFE